MKTIKLVIGGTFSLVALVVFTNIVGYFVGFQESLALTLGLSLFLVTELARGFLKNK